jgi:hypothetical protein
MMTRKHYRIVADAINRVGFSRGRKYFPSALMQLIGELSVEFSQENPRFKYARFAEACFKPQATETK